MFSELLKPHLRELHPCTIEEVTARTHKEQRMADTLEPVMNQHRLIMSKEAIKRDHAQILTMPPDTAQQYSLLYQMSHLTRERGSLDHDDKLDAVAMAVEYWALAMANDADASMRHRRDAAMDKAIETMHDVINRKSGPEDSDSWFRV